MGNSQQNGQLLCWGIKQRAARRGGALNPALDATFAFPGK